MNEDQQLAQNMNMKPQWYELDHSSPLPTNFVESIAQIRRFALQKFDREIEQKQLFYHTREHVENVQRRTHKIFQAIYPDEMLTSNVHLFRTRLLLDLCATAHDMIQVFLPQLQAHATRRREVGVSERATIGELLVYISELNQRLQLDDLCHAAIITNDEIEVIRSAIAATICAYDPIEQAIYQPDLAHTNSIPIVARILALADIGALGMEGIQAYQQEGSLLFLEENLDLIPLLLEGSLDRLDASDPALYENLRQRLLKRCRFQVNFAKSRLKRFRQEILGLPEEAIAALTDIFGYLTPATIETIAALTPTDEETSLKEMVEFFEFEHYLEQ
jgi:hypothetical protein